MKSFDEIFVDKTKYGVKVQTTEYSEVGEHIIIDQGQSQIAGYTDRQEGLFEEVPVVIFGDHTRVIKYVDEPFFLGRMVLKYFEVKMIMQIINTCTMHLRMQEYQTPDIIDISSG